MQTLCQIAHYAVNNKPNCSYFPCFLPLVSQQEIQKWRTVASLWKILCVLLTHMGDSLTPQTQSRQRNAVHHVQTPEKAQEEGRTTWSKADDMRMRKKLWSLFKKATPAVFTKLWPHQALCYQWGCNTHRHAHTPRHITFLFVSAGGKLSTDISTQRANVQVWHTFWWKIETCVSTYTARRQAMKNIEDRKKRQT